jgi:hypothetical protein
VYWRKYRFRLLSLIILDDEDKLIQDDETKINIKKEVILVQNKIVVVL